MINLSELDDLAFDLILSHLRYIDLYNLSLANRALRSIVANASLRTLNCTKVYSVPLQLLPYAAEQRLLDQPDWRVMAYNKGNRREDVHLCQLYWTSRHNHFNSISLRNVILDGTRINVLDIIHFVTAAPHLEYLSVRFCIEVHRLLLQNFLDTLSTKSPISLERLDVLGIDGIPFFEPLNNGSFAFNETEIELTGAGPEFDYQDRWREDMYDFRMSLERVPTSHGQRIMSDIARCSQSYCRNFNLGRQELADPTIYETLPTCIICQAEWTLPICRPCITARSCKLCKTFICPRCKNPL